MSSEPVGSPQWTADVEVDAARVRRLLARQFPALAGATIVPFGNGWNNAAFLVDDAYAPARDSRPIVPWLSQR